MWTAELRKNKPLRSLTGKEHFKVTVPLSEVTPLRAASAHRHLNGELFFTSTGERKRLTVAPEIGLPAGSERKNSIVRDARV
jgi:hypothetical protein